MDAACVADDGPARRSPRLNRLPGPSSLSRVPSQGASGQRRASEFERRLAVGAKTRRFHADGDCNIHRSQASAWVMKDIAEQLVGSLNEFLAFARGRLGEPELAADAVQESLLKALRSSDQIRDEESVKAWFYRILRRTIIDLYRRRDVRQRAEEALRAELDAPPDNEEERVTCACVERLIPSLKPEYATLVRRLDLNGEQVAPVAESLGITKNNLTVRLHRARQQLRQRLEETCRVCAKHGCLDCTCAETERN